MATVQTKVLAMALLKDKPRGSQEEARRYTAGTQKVQSKVRTEVHKKYRPKYAPRYAKSTGSGTQKVQAWYRPKYAAWLVNLTTQRYWETDECNEIFKLLREGIVLLRSARIVSKQMS